MGTGAFGASRPFYERRKVGAPVSRLDDETGSHIIADDDPCREMTAPPATTLTAPPVRYSEQAARVRADRSLLKGFIEETLRFESPVQGLVRQTMRDVELGGVAIPKGAVVVVRYGAANRDPARFACPHRFDIARRNAGGHMAFGAGTHFCPGATLARQEMTSASNAVLDRMADLRLARPLPDLPHGPNLMQFPIKELPVAFSPAGCPPPASPPGYSVG